MTNVRRALRAFTWWFASVMGDRDYENYARHLRARHPGRPVPSEREFWRQRWADAEANPGARCC